MLASQVVVIKIPEEIGFTKDSKSCGWLFQLAFYLLGTTATCKLSMLQVLGLWLHLRDTVMLFLGLGLTITGNCSVVTTEELRHSLDQQLVASESHSLLNYHSDLTTVSKYIVKSAHQRIRYKTAKRN